MAEATPQQISKWEAAKRKAAALNKLVNAAVLKGEIIGEALRIGRSNGVTLATAASFISEVQEYQQRDGKIQNIVAAVETGDLGIRNSIDKPGDLDIMAGPGTTDDELIQYNGLGIVGVILIGIVVVVGFSALLMLHIERSNAIEARYEATKEFCGTRFSNESPEALEQWNDFLASPQHLQKKTTWERMEDEADDLLDVVADGAKWGLLIAIPIAAWLLFGKKR